MHIYLLNNLISLNPVIAIVTLIALVIGFLVFGAITSVYPGMPRFPFSRGVGGLICRVFDIDGSSSYTTGGTSITAASLGLSKIFFVHCMAANDSSHHVQAAGVGKGFRTSFKLMWFVASTGAELAAAQNVSSKSAKVMVIGLP